jgi:hypothetical protein
MEPGSVRHQQLEHEHERRVYALRQVNVDADTDAIVSVEIERA